MNTLIIHGDKCVTAYTNSEGLDQSIRADMQVDQIVACFYRQCTNL